jgi:VanZ family protein
MSSKVFKQILRTIPLISWSALIFYLSSQNAVSVVSQREADISIHKLAHVIEYGMLYIFFMFAFCKNKSQYSKVSLYGLIFVGLYAVSDELHQSFNPTRGPRVTDVFVDLLGALVADFSLRKILKI